MSGLTGARAPVILRDHSHQRDSPSHEMADMSDDCSRCHGARGGVKGNENIIDGALLCDYCHADDLQEGVCLDATASWLVES